MIRPPAGILAVVWLLLASSLSAQSRQIRISNDPACRGCRIVLERVVTLGSSGEPALGRMTELAVDSRGRFFAAPTYDPGKIVMYDARGTVTRMFGRSG
ncbi:MAG TPA: hypothetical protein VF771_15925, partial [Longimicrobiaceae bacterium]